MLKKTKKGKNKLRRGFTLVELLAVIVILAIILAVAVPTISSLIQDAKEKALAANAKMVLKAIEYKKLEDSTFDPTDPTDLNINNIESVLGVDSANISAFTVTMVNGKPSISITGTEQWEGLSASGTFDSVAVTDTPTAPTLYSDATGASIPELSTGMIPIVYDSTNSVWKKADLTQNWYDYATQKWANAVLVTSASRSTYQNAAVGTTINEADVMAYLVWVPRYKYKLFNVEAAAISPQSIEIVFEKKTDTKSTGSTNGTYLTHPAFTFGTTELSGIWVGKFEITGDTTTPTVKPNIASLRAQAISGFYDTMRKMDATVDTVGTYGLATTNNAHMMKNMEWGAVAYLSHSTYGKNSEMYINNSSTFITGCSGGSTSAASYSGCQNTYNSTNGLGASTTGNITGIYDMSGGAYEYVMGGMYDTDNTTLKVAYTGFVQATIDDATMTKYVNKYTNGTTYNDQTAYNRRQLGDATGEVRGWYSDNGYIVFSNYSWFIRGGYYLSGVAGGAFYFYCNGGAAINDYSSRLVIS